MQLVTQVSEDGEPLEWEIIGQFETNQDRPITVVVLRLERNIQYTSRFEVQFRHLTKHATTGLDMTIRAAVAATDVNLDGEVSVLPLVEAEEDTLDAIMSRYRVPEALQEQVRSNWTEIIIPVKAGIHQAYNILADGEQGTFEPDKVKIAKHVRNSDQLNLLVEHEGPITQVASTFTCIEKGSGVDAFLSNYNPKVPLFIQPNELKEFHDVPVREIPVRISFQDKIDFHFLHGYALRKDHEAQTKEKGVTLYDIPLSLVTIPGAVDQRYFGFFDAYHVKHFYVGAHDEVEVKMDNVAASSAVWHGHVMETPAVTPMGKICIAIMRPFDRRGQGYENTTKVDAVDWQQLASIVVSREAISNARPRMVSLKFVVSNKHFQRLTAAMTNFYKEGSERVLDLVLANDLTSLDVVDAFSTLGPESDEREYKIFFGSNFSREQMRIAQGLKKARGGLVLIQAPPGTGKTYTMVQLAQAHINWGNVEKRLQLVMFVVPSNAAANELTTRVVRATQEYRRNHHFKQPNTIIVHVFDIETSRRQVEKPYLHRAEGAKPGRPLIIPAPDEVSALIGEFLGATLLFKQHQARFQTLLGYNNRHMKTEQWSLGWWMAVLGGFTEESEVPEGIDTYPEKFKDLADLLEHVAKNEDMIPLEKTDLTNAITKLRNEVLIRARAMILTPSRMADPKIYTPVGHRATWVIIDEASQVKEVETIAILHSYPNVTARIMVGDSRQCTVIVNSTETNNFAVKQLKLSFFQRMQWAGHSTYSLTQSRRANPRLTAALSQLYRGEICSHPDTANRPKSIVYENLFEQLFGRKDTLIVLDVGRTKTSSANTSKLNEGTAQVVIQLLHTLINTWSIGGEEVLLITPYLAQQQLVKRCIAMLGGDLERVTMSSIDGAQSRERNLEILDLVITDRMGFLRDSHRIVTAASRCLDGLILVVDLTTVVECSEFRQSALETLLVYATEQGLVVSWSKIQQKMADLPETVATLMPSYQTEAQMSEMQEAQRKLRNLHTECKRCHEIGHTRTDCPHPPEVGMICHTCKVKGHKASRCPTIRCPRCGGSAHRRNDCTSTVEVTCGHCNAHNDHTTEMCPRVV